MRFTRSGLRAALEVVATLAMLIASGVLVWAGLTAKIPDRATEARASAPIDPRTVAYQIGDRLDPIPGLESVTTDTLLIYLRSGCPYCTESMDFYRRLRAGRSSVPVVVVGPEPQNVLETYLASHDLKVDRIISVPPGTLRLPGTPVLLVFDRDQVVRHLWLGRLSSDKESEVLEAISR